VAEIYLSIGSNIDPEVHLEKCAHSFEAEFTKPLWSPVYRSAAVGMEGEDFLNAVVVAHTDKSIESTCSVLRRIEDQLGRIREENKFSSRTLDIDLLLYNDVVTNNNEITLPRAEITSALYVLAPLVDIAPLKIHPVTGKTYQVLLEELERQPSMDSVKLFKVALNLGTKPADN